MKYVALAERVAHENSATCKVYEYPMAGTPIDCAIGEINGRYPEAGYCVNRDCHETGLVLGGEGQIEINGVVQALKVGDAVLIEAGEHFAWQGQLMLSLGCTPSWTPEQHQAVASAKPE